MDRMRTIDRRTVLTAMGAGSLVGLAGCTGGDGDDGGGSEYHVGMVYALGGLGDESFNDMAHVGVQRAEEEFDIAYQNAEPDSPGDVNTLQRQFASNEDPVYDLICCIGFIQQSDLVENAQEFDDRSFTLVDAVAETEGGDPVGNVANYVFREQEGSFQVGHLAGLLTAMEYDHGGGETDPDERLVGFVGGEEVPLIERFEAGFRAGVRYADTDAEVTSAYAGSWSDPATGQEIATSMYQDGADVVYHAAGGTGSGVFEAAQSEGRYAIGVDDDQSQSAAEFSDVIVASMIKRVDNAVYESIQNVVNDDFQGGSVNDLGLEEEGVGVVIGQDFEDEIPEEITEALESSRQGIVDGDIEVPDNLDDL